MSKKLKFYGYLRFDFDEFVVIPPFDSGTFTVPIYFNGDAWLVEDWIDALV